MIYLVPAILVGLCLALIVLIAAGEPRTLQQQLDDLMQVNRLKLTIFNEVVQEYGCHDPFHYIRLAREIQEELEAACALQEKIEVRGPAAYW